MTRLLVVAAVTALAVWAVVAWRTQQANVATSAICARVNVLDSALLSILNRSFKGLPANPYYRQHPSELAAALRNTQYAIDELEQARC